MALDTFIAGRYSSTFNAVDIGITEGGYELQIDSKTENIEESDAYGQTLIDWIYRGGNMMLQCESLAYKAGSITPLWPYGALGVAGVIGRLASALALPVVLTATPATPAAAAPATLTGLNSLLAPNNPARLLFNSKLRKVPIRLQLLAYDAGSSVIKWFTTS